MSIYSWPFPLLHSQKRVWKFCIKLGQGLLPLQVRHWLVHPFFTFSMRAALSEFKFAESVLRRFRRFRRLTRCRIVDVGSDDPSSKATLELELASPPDVSRNRLATQPEQEQKKCLIFNSIFIELSSTKLYYNKFKHKYSQTCLQRTWMGPKKVAVIDRWPLFRGNLWGLFSWWEPIWCPL